MSKYHRNRIHEYKVKQRKHEEYVNELNKMVQKRNILFKEVKSLDNNIYSAYIKKNTNKSALKTFAKLPPLIKGYLRIGGRVSENCFVDHSFNTIDLCVIVKTENIDQKYMKKFLN